MGLAWIDRSEAGKLGVGAPDALPFLQALLTADLARVPVGSGAATALLAPRGQVRSLGRALRTERGWLLHCERPALEGLFRGLWTGRVGWNVAIHRLTVQQCLVSVAGEAEELARPAGALELAESGGILHLARSAGAPELAHRAARFAGIAVRAVRTWAGVDLIARADRREALLDALGAVGAEPLDQPGWDGLRIARGRLVYGQDALESMLPAELGLDPSIVATDKGLYPGLQTVLRQERSGTIHRRLCRVHAEHALLAVGDELMDGESAVGRLTSALAFDGLALVRGDPAASLRHAATGTPVRIEPLVGTAPSL